MHEGEPHGAFLVVVGVCFGAVFIALTQRALRDQEDVKFGLLRGADARKTLLMVGIMTAHSLGEGSGVGVSFGGERGWTQGTLVTLAIGAHNIPEGMAVATVLAARGISPWKCAGWAVVTSLPQPLLAVPAFMFVETFAALLPLGMGFASGCMIWITVAELLPDALEGADASAVATAATVAAAALEAFRMWTEALERADARLGLGTAATRVELTDPSSIVSTGAYSTITTGEDHLETGEDHPSSKAALKPKPRPEPGLGATLTTGSFVPADSSRVAESAVEALDRLARSSSEKKAAGLRAAELARATAEGAGIGLGAVATSAPADASSVSVTASRASATSAAKGDPDSTFALAAATMVVPLVCLLAAFLLPRLLGDHDDAPLSPLLGSSRSKSGRFRGAARPSRPSGEFLFPLGNAHLLGAAAGAGAFAGFARLADAFRRCRFGDAPWLPAISGAVVGALAAVLLAEYALGRAEARHRRRDGEKTGGADEDRPGAPRSSGAEWTEFGDAENQRNGLLNRSGRLSTRDSWMFRGTRDVLFYACVWFASSEGLHLSAAAAAHGGHAAFPAAARVFPRACVVGWSALAAGRNRWGAASDVCLATIAEPSVLLLASLGFGFGVEGFIEAGRPSASAVALQAATAAALLCAATRTAAVVARRENKKNANRGLVFGAVASGLTIGILGALCWQTPYCDRSW
jgi:zinc transporter ZupT